MDGGVLEVLAAHAPLDALDALQQRLEDVLDIDQLRAVHQLGQSLQAVEQKLFISHAGPQVLLHPEVDLAIDEESAAIFGQLL